MNIDRKVLFIVGPTATGKTAVSLRLSEQYPLEIVSADSMQVYRNLDIGTDKVSLAERSRIPHHLLDIRDPDESFSAFEYRHCALEAIKQIHSRQKLPVVVGGSGLYLRALIDGMKPQASASKSIRDELELAYEEYGAGVVYAELQQLNPKRAACLHPNDKRRVIRALEIARQSLEAEHVADSESGDSLPLSALGYSVLMIGLMGDRSQMYRRVEERVDEMLKNGFIKEVSSVMDDLSPATKQAVGYKEIIEYIEDRVSLEQAVREMKKKSRHLVKKQCTWFKRNEDIVWVDVDRDGESDAVMDRVRAIVDPWIAS